jgi:DNA-binding phage protein
VAAPNVLGIPSSSLLRSIDEKHNPTQQTLERLLEPFGLRIGLTPLERSDDGEAARTRPRRLAF